VIDKILIILLIMSSAAAADRLPGPVSVPDGLSSEIHESLQKDSDSLDRRQKVLRSRVEAHNSKCDGVEADSPEDIECREAYERLIGEMQSLAAETLAFNNTVKQMVVDAISTLEIELRIEPKTEQELEAERDRAQLGTEQPPEDAHDETTEETIAKGTIQYIPSLTSRNTSLHIQDVPPPPVGKSHLPYELPLPKPPTNDKTAKIHSVRGKVFKLTAKGWVAVDRNTKLKQGETLWVQPGGYVMMVVKGGSKVVLRPRPDKPGEGFTYLPPKGSVIEELKLWLKEQFKSPLEKNKGHADGKRG